MYILHTVKNFGLLTSKISFFVTHLLSYMINNPSLAYTQLEKQLSTIIKRLNATEGRITLILSHLIGYDAWRRPHPEKNNSKGKKLVNANVSNVSKSIGDRNKAHAPNMMKHVQKMPQTKRDKKAPNPPDHSEHNASNPDPSQALFEFASKFELNIRGVDNSLFDSEL